MLIRHLVHVVHRGKRYGLTSVMGRLSLIERMRGG
jgi:hypothetical protein